MSPDPQSARILKATGREKWTVYILLFVHVGKRSSALDTHPKPSVSPYTIDIF